MAQRDENATVTDDGAGRPAPVESPLARGATLGRFVVLGVVGAGGMGVVLSAYDPDLDRKVALKLLRDDPWGGGDGLGRERLIREARAMAALAHPNVVTVHEVGVVDDAAFVVMEFVDGATLRAWLDERPRPWREVLAIFLQAAEGLAAAHRAGLVHRDFKPENVLIGRDGRARVTDFGLVAAARERSAADAPAAVDARITVTGALLGTPAYMAPEQLASDRSDARADQFAFCVALHEALWGVRPFGRGSPAELLDAIEAGRLVEPPRGAAVPAWVRSAITRGLAAAPADRWPSIEALTAALRRDPATARRRWIAGAVGAALVTGVAAVGFSFGRGDAPAGPSCDAGATHVADVWDEAAQARVRAAFDATGRPHAADTFLRVDTALRGRLDTWAAGHRDACEATHVRGEQSEALLDQRMHCLDRARAELVATVELLGRADEALLDRAVRVAASAGAIESCADADVLAAIPPPRDPDQARRVDAVRDRLARVSAAWRAGRYDEGLPLAREVLAEARATGYDPVIAEALFEAAQLEWEKGDVAAAETQLHEAIRRAAAARDDGLAARAWRLLLWGVVIRGDRYADAPVLLAAAEAAVDRAGGDPQLRADFLDARAQVWAEQGRYTDAAAGFEEALALLVRVHGDNHVEVASTLVQLAGAQEGLGQFRDAIATYDRALATYEETLGPEHPNVVILLNNKGIALQQLGAWDEAAAIAERVLAIRERSYPAEHPAVATAHHNLAVVRSGQKRLDDARAHYERAIAIREVALGPEHPLLATSLTGLGSVASQQGRRDEARRLQERALAIKERKYGPDHPSVAYSLLSLANLHADAGDHRAARPLYERALAIREAKHGPEHALLAPPLRGIGTALRAEGRPREALRLYERALAIQERSVGPDHEEVLYTLVKIGEVLTELGRPDEAVTRLERALVLAGAHPILPREAGWVRLRLAQALWSAGGDRDRALALAREARALLAEAPGAPELADADRWLASRGR